eukprot:1157703-Pelagomonas_calceolata.AAC.2
MAWKDKASWQQLMDKEAKYIAQRHARQTAEPNLHTLSATTKQALAAGEPCAQAFKSKKFSIASFPYPAAMGKWLKASKHGRFGQE